MECKRCGRCCSEPFYRQVRPDDLEEWKARGRDDLVRIYEEESSKRDHRNPSLAALAMPLHTCRFLKPDGPGTFSCSIYEFRPLTCREFEVGCSRLCPCYPGKSDED